MHDFSINDDNITFFSKNTDIKLVLYLKSEHKNHG